MSTLYGIVWVAIFFAFCIYCLAFIKVWHNRHELSGLFNPFNEDPFAGTITTDIEIVRTSRYPSSTSDSKPSDDRCDPEAGQLPIPGVDNKGTQNGFDPYSVNVEADPQDADTNGRPTRPEVFHVRSMTRNHALSKTNPDAWLYARAAFLFFCALLISWVVPSINRLYSLANPDKLNFGLNYTVTIVLPLQGFWNTCVYIITSQTACKNLIRSMRGKPELPRRNAYVDDSDLDKAGNDPGRSLPKKGVNKAIDKVAAGLSKSSKGGGKFERLDNAKGLERQSVRTESDVSSVMSLAAVHHR